MPLTDAGKESNTPTGKTILTTNEENEKVVIATTIEAIQDYGKSTIVSVASDKYDKQEVVPNTSPVQVLVTTTDCANAASPNLRN